MDFGGSQVLGALVGFLVLLFARWKKKKHEVRKQDVRKYDPVEPEGPAGRFKSSRLVSTVSRAYALVVLAVVAMALLIMMMEGQPIHWLFYAAVGVAVLVYLILKAKESNVTPQYNPQAPWKEQP